MNFMMNETLHGFCSTTLKRLIQKIWNFFETYQLVAFSIYFFMLNLSYPIIITWDSGHYLWLSSLIRERQWWLWDPIRNIAFPLLVHASRVIFGDNANATHFFLATSFCITFVAIVYIVNYALNLKSQKKVPIIYITLLITFFIMIDPIIFGYYNTLLTEFVSSTIAVSACLISVYVYRKVTELKRDQFIFFIGLLILLVVVSWHIKQPYVGAALFPFIILATVLFVNKSTQKKSGIVVIGIATSILLVLLSNNLWYSFLKGQGNPLPQNRLITTFLIKNNRNRLACSSPDEAEDVSILSRYLAFANFNVLDQSQCKISLTPCLNCAAENGAIAQRAFNLQNYSNVFFTGPYTEYTTMFVQTDNFPSGRINAFFINRIPITNSMFTISFLVLPFVVIFSILFFLRTKAILSMILVLLSGTSFANILSDVIFGILPIDRYLLYSYVLNLIILVIILIQLSRWLLSILRHKFLAFLAKSESESKVKFH